LIFLRPDYGTAIIKDIKYKVKKFNNLEALKKLFPDTVCFPKITIQGVKRHKKGVANLVGKCAYVLVCLITHTVVSSN